MFKHYNTNQLILEINLAQTFEGNDLVVVINHFVESMPESCFDAFNHRNGASSYHPKMMVKVLIYAYSQSIFSGRKIEFLIQDSKWMEWLCQGYQPSYRIINRFRVDPRCESLYIYLKNQFKPINVKCMKNR